MRNSPGSRFLALLAFVGFVLAAVVHLAALAGFDVSERAPSVWLLHFGIFVVFVPFVISSRRVLGAKPSLSNVRALMPDWVVVVEAVVLVYAIVNFAIFAVTTQGGIPSVVDGKYVLQSHGRLIREITRAEYTAFRANELRGFSGHWLVFYSVPFAYFMFAKRPNARDRKSADECLNGR